MLKQQYIQGKNTVGPTLTALWLCHLLTPSAVALALVWVLPCQERSFSILLRRYSQFVCYKNKAHRHQLGRLAWGFFFFFLSWYTVNFNFLLLKMSLFGWRALNPHRQQAVFTSLYAAMALSWAASPQRTWLPCSLITGFQDGKETSESQFLVYHSIFSLFILMQTNAIHLGFLLLPPHHLFLTLINSYYKSSHSIPVLLVSQLCPTCCDPMDCSPPGSYVHGFSRQED